MACPRYILEAQKGTLEKYKKYLHDWYQKNRNTVRQSQKKYRLTRVRFLHNLLGNRCNDCGNTDFRVLEIDHIYGGGNFERLSFKHRDQYIAHLIIFAKSDSMSFCSKYQLLCANCNRIKRYTKREYGNKHNTAQDAVSAIKQYV